MIHIRRTSHASFPWVADVEPFCVCSCHVPGNLGPRRHAKPPDASRWQTPICTSRSLWSTLLPPYSLCSASGVRLDIRSPNSPNTPEAWTHLVSTIHPLRCNVQGFRGTLDIDAQCSTGRRLSDLAPLHRDCQMSLLDPRQLIFDSDYNDELSFWAHASTPPSHYVGAL